MYGSIFIQICAVGSKRRIFSAPVCVLAVLGRSVSSKVADFGTNRKRVCNFLLVGHCDCGHNGRCDHSHHDNHQNGRCDHTTSQKLAPFLRYGDLLAKNCLFFLPLSHSAPSLPMFPLEFWGEVKRAGNYSHGAILQWGPHDRSLSRFDSVPACDGQTDGRIYYS